MSQLSRVGFIDKLLYRHLANHIKAVYQYILNKLSDAFYRQYVFSFLRYYFFWSLGLD